MNVHVPERQDGESFEGYKARRAQSRAITDRMTLRGLAGGKSSRAELRALQRRNGNFIAGSFGKGLIASFTAKQKAALKFETHVIVAPIREAA